MNPKVKQLIDTLNSPALLGTGVRDAHKRQALALFALDVSLGISPESRFIDPVLLTYLEKLMLNPVSINGRDIELLNAVGYTEDDIYELTLSVALGAKLSVQDHLMAGSQTRVGQMPAAGMALA